jgi:hypothetical protein
MSRFGSSNCLILCDLSNLNGFSALKSARLHRTHTPCTSIVAMDHALVALADMTTNSAGAAPCPSVPHYHDPIGASEAPTHAPPSAAIPPDETNAHASLIDDHLSECPQESHLSACTAETHVSVITAETHVSVIAAQTHVSLVTEGSMLNAPGPLPFAEETTATPPWDEAGNPESISVKGPAQYAIVALTSNDETHNIPHDSASRSPMVDSDNPETITMYHVECRIRTCEDYHGKFCARTVQRRAKNAQGRARPRKNHTRTRKERART